MWVIVQEEENVEVLNHGDYKYKYTIRITCKEEEKNKVIVVKGVGFANKQYEARIKALKDLQDNISALRRTDQTFLNRRKGKNRRK
jgi:hypothetical protein